MESPIEKISPQDDRQWQQRLLPLMTRMIIILTVFFFISSLGQLAYLQWAVLQPPKMSLEQVALSSLSSDNAIAFEERERIMHLTILATLEAQSLEQRHHRANIASLSSLWIRYLSFVTGMILALIGASFILGKLRESGSEFKATSPVTSFAFSSASPGLILVAFGTILIITTLVMQHNLEVHDKAIYLSEWVTSESSATFGASEEIPRLDPLSDTTSE